MSGTWTLRTPEECTAPDREFDDKDEAKEQAGNHAALCETCNQEDVELIPPGEGKTTETTTDGGKPEPEPPAPANTDETNIESQEQFVSEIAGVPSIFVKDMGTDDDPSPHVTKEGLCYLGRQLDFQIRAEPVVPSWEVDEGKVVYKGIVEDDDGRVWEDYGTASYGEEIVGDENLDELASTRATNRALRLATGMGMTSLEEMEDGAPNAVSDRPDPEVVEVEEVNADA